MADFRISNHAFLPRRETVPDPRGYLSGGWSHRLPITLAPVATTLKGFSFQLEITHSSLRLQLYGGNVTWNDGRDITISDATGELELPFQIESWDPSTGQLIARVLIPILSASVATGLYLYHGNVAAKVSTASVWTPGEALVAKGDILDGVVHNDVPMNRDGRVFYGLANQMVGLNGLPAFELDPAAVRFPPVRMAGGFTLTTLIKSYAQPGSGLAILFDSQGDDGSIQISQTQDSHGSGPGKLVVEIIQGLLTQSATFSIGAVLDHGWHHLALTFDDTGLACYLDGSLAGSTGLIVNAGLDTRQFITLGGLWKGQISLLRLASFVKSLPWLALERSNTFGPSLGFSVGVLQGVPTVTMVAQDTEETPITLSGDVDLNHVFSDHNAFYQDPASPVVSWSFPPGGIPPLMDLPTWQRLGQDLHSRIFDPNDPVVAANLESYLDPLFYKVDDFIHGLCCARFMFCTGAIDINPCDPTIPIFIQHLRSDAAAAGWTDDLEYPEADAQFRFRTYCGPCDAAGLLSPIPTNYP